MTYATKLIWALINQDNDGVCYFCGAATNTNDCRDCAEEHMRNDCPNCGSELLSLLDPVNSCLMQCDNCGETSDAYSYDHDHDHDHDD